MTTMLDILLLFATGVMVALVADAWVQFIIEQGTKETK